MAKISLTYPESGLTVNISVLNQATEVEDFSGTANEIGTSKTYVFTFTEVASTDYTYIATVTGYDSMSGSLFASAGGGGGGATAEEVADAVRTELTPELDKINTNLDAKVSNVGGGGGGWGGRIDLSWIGTNFTKLNNIVKEENEKLKEHIDTKSNDIKSDIYIAKSQLSDKINSIEIPETDLSSINEGIGTLKQRFTKLSEWLKIEHKKEMENKDKENEGKLSELQKKIDDMEETFQEMKNLSKSELDEKKTLINEMEEAAKEIIDELEKEKETTKEETEKEVKNKIISSLS